MNGKKIISILLGIFLAAGVIVLVYKSINTTNAKAPASTEGRVEAQSALDNGIMAYYFHTTARCASCMKIENLSKQSIEKLYSEELKNGKMIFTSINVEEAQNSHFIQDYQLYSKSLVISLIKNGKEHKYENLAEVWKHLLNENAFENYVKTKIDAYLKEI